MMDENSQSAALQALSNEELLNRAQRLAENERQITLRILHCFREIERRRAFAKPGYSSLWEYAIKELKYAESSAYRRISAMRALKEHPGLEGKVQAGSLSITTISQVQSFLKAEQNQAHKSYTSGQKRELFEKCQSKSTREVTRELITLSPLAFKVQKERVLSEDRTELSFVVESTLLGKIHRVRDLSAARLKNPGSYPELVDLMSEFTLDEIDPLRRPIGKGRSEKSDSRSGNRPHISNAIRTQIWREFGGKCAYSDPKSGARCSSTFGLEIEHCQPHSLGGSSLDPANLRLLCKAHNQWQAIQTYGLSKMEPYLNNTKLSDG